MAASPALWASNARLKTVKQLGIKAKADGKSPVNRKSRVILHESRG